MTIVRQLGKPAGLVVTVVLATSCQHAVRGRLVATAPTYGIGFTRPAVGQWLYGRLGGFAVTGAPVRIADLRLTGVPPAIEVGGVWLIDRHEVGGPIPMSAYGPGTPVPANLLAAPRGAVLDIDTDDRWVGYVKFRMLRPGEFRTGGVAVRYCDERDRHCRTVDADYYVGTQAR